MRGLASVGINILRSALAVVFYTTAFSLCASSSGAGEEVSPSLRMQAQSQSYSVQILDAGSSPADWPNRGFIPASTINSILQNLVGTEYVSKVGVIDKDGTADGSFVIRLNAISATASAGQLLPKLSFSARYEAGRISDLGFGSRVDLSAEALLLPVVAADGKSAALKIAIIGIEPDVVWNPFATARNAFAAKVLASEAAKRLTEDRLTVPLPNLNANLDFKVALENTSHSKFDVEGGYDLTAKLSGPSVARSLSAPYPLVSTSGIWLLGGKTVPLKESAYLPVDDAAAQADIERQAALLASRLAPYSAQSDEVELRVSNHELTEAVSELIGPKESRKKYTVFLTTSQATGIIARQHLLKDDLLGEVGLSVRPENEHFARGEVAFSVADFKWVEGQGVEVRIDANAEAWANLDVHLSTGFVGGGIGKDVALFGTANTSVTVKLTLAKISTKAGDAVVIQPEIGCAPIEATIYPSVKGAVIDQTWFKLGSVGLRIKRTIGGGGQNPTVLLDSLPKVYAFRAEKDPLARSFVRYPRKAIRVALGLSTVAVEKDGLLLRTKISSELSDDASDSTGAATALKEEVSKLRTVAKCDESQELALMVSGVEIGPRNELVVFIVRSLRDGIKIADEARKVAEKILGTTLEAAARLTDDVVRQGARAVHDAIETAKKAAEDAKATAEKAAKDAAAAAKKAADDAKATADKAAKDAAAAAEKALKDLKKIKVPKIKF
jgi:hypothetical protein